MRSPLAHRNLFHDKVRLAVTLTGVVFAVVLIVMELGLFFGFIKTTSCLIDHSRADLWITARRVPYLELDVPIKEQRLYQIKAVPGVADAERFVNHAAWWTRADGARETVRIAGFNPDDNLGGPWNLVEGNVRDLKTPDGVIVDEFYKKTLGVNHIGEVFEIRGHRARVVGFTKGIRSFTTEPYVFTAVQHAQDFAAMPTDEITYILVKTAPGVNSDTVRKNILARVKDVDVLTTPEFGRMTESYWTLKTGAGIAILLAAALGLVVGFVVVAQTIYATTMDHVKEFGTLKAMGAPNSYIYKVILTQAAIAAVIGYTLGMIISNVLVHYAQPAGAPIIMTWWLVLGMFALTLIMCCGAAVISINKVTKLDPAMVFKG